MSITGSNNPFACNPVVFANANSIVSLGTITRDGNQFTFSVGFVWKINGVTYQNTAPVVITIAEASEGFNRIDNALLNTSNTIELQQGLESETIALRPVAPDTNIILTSWNISGNSVGDTQSPVVGGDFKQKTENLSHTYSTSGASVLLPLRGEGQNHYIVDNENLISVHGFDKTLLRLVRNAEWPYEGKDYLFENKSPNSVQLNHLTNAEIPFVLPNEENLIVPSGGCVWFKFKGDQMAYIMKSWNDPVDISQKADLVGGKVPASQLPSSVFNVIEGYYNGTNFYTDAGFTNLITPESGKIYINIAVTPAMQYRWSGSAYVEIGGGGTTPISVLGKKSLPSSILTGTTSETILETIVIPANTLVSGDLLLFRNRVFKSGGNNGFVCRCRISNTNSLSGAFQIAYASLPNSSYRSQGIERTLNVRSNSIEVIDPTSSHAYENSTTINQNLSFSLDFSQPIYLFITANLINASETIVNSNYALLKL